MASEIIIAHLWVAAVSGRARGAYATLFAQVGKQFLLVLGSARGSPRGAALIVNCSRTFFGPQRLYRARSDVMCRLSFCIKVRGATT